jgi:predicted DNA-binding transcriptional regulator YafY
MLQIIPREPAGISVQQLRQKLAQADPLYDVHKRTIERNLMQLMGIFPSLDYREHSGGNLWFWDKDTVLDVPRLDAKTALMFRLAKDYLTPILPKATLNELNPHFKQAERTLKEVGEKSYSNWPDKVRFIQNSIQLKHPEISPEILGVVYDALFEDRKLAVKYRIRSGEQKDYQMSLLGLVFRDGVIYAVCTLEGREHVRQLPVHRVVTASLMEEASDRLEGFDLDAYVRTYFDYPLRELQGNADHRDEIPETISVQLALNPVSAVHLCVFQRL